MALNIKVALLTSLFFIGGMCWMVSQVARPIVEMPTPLVAGTPDTATTIADAARYGPDPMRVRARSLSQPSSADVMSIEKPALARLDDSIRSIEASTPSSLPPLVSRNAALAGAVDSGAVSPSLASAAQVATPEPARPTAIPEVILRGTLEPEPIPQDMIALRRPEARRETITLASMTPATDATLATYNIRPGDTLRRIARRVMGARTEKQIDVSVVALLAANPRLSKRPDLIKAGEALRIPGSPAMRTVATHDAKQPSKQRHRTNANERWYTVRKNDSLAKIARVVLKDERRWPEIAKLNGMQDANRIRPGVRIQLPSQQDET